MKQKKEASALVLTADEFAHLWNDSVFSTTGDAKILHDFFRDLMVRERLHHGTYWLIDCALFAGAIKRYQPKPAGHLSSAKSRDELQQVSALIGKIKASPFGFVLNTQADELMNLANAPLTDAALAAKLTHPFLESGDAKTFVAGLTLLDQFAATRAKYHVETFFADVLAGWFRKTLNKPRRDLVCRIIGMCFYGDAAKGKSINTLDEACREHRAKFKRWRRAVSAWLSAAAKHRVASLPA